jgi:PAS domain-containing protein
VTAQITQATDSVRRAAMTTSKAVAEQGGAAEQIAAATTELMRQITSVSRAMTEQAASASQMVTAVDSTRVQAEQLARAAAEQARTVKEMSRSTDGTARDIKSIIDANRQHSSATARVVAQLGDVRRVTERNLEGVRKTRGGTVDLLKQAETLTGIMDEAISAKTTPNGHRRDAERGLMQRSPGLGVVTTDRNLIVRSWNDWMVSATGVGEGTVLGRSLLEYVPPERVELYRELFTDVLQRGTARVLAPAFHHYLIACPPQVVTRHFDLMQQRVTVAPLTAAAKVVGVMVTIEDVTERLEQERTLTAQLHEEGSVASPAAALQAVGADDWKLRGAAVRSLRQSASLDDVRHLLASLQRDHQDLNVLSSALQVLIGSDRDVVAPLTELLADPEPNLRMHAALALGQLKAAAAVPELIGVLDDADQNVRFHAIEALGRIGAGDAVEPLVRIAESGDFFLAFPAIDALARIDDAQVTPALVRLLDNELLRPQSSTCSGRSETRTASPRSSAF